MDIIRAQQIALDDALVTPTNRLTISKSNLRLSSYLKSKEPTLQVVYDVLKLTPFYKAFQIIADVPEIYMQEFWATATLHKSWRSFTAVINKCLSGKSTGYDSLRLSQAQILWGMYHKKNVDYAYLLWDDFVYQVENKNVKELNEMCNLTLIPKVVSRHEDTRLYGAILPDEMTNKAIKDYESYKEYYVIASGAEPPKTKASVKKKQAGSDKTKTPPTAKGKRLKTLAKAAKPAKKKQPAKMSKAKGLICCLRSKMNDNDKTDSDNDDDDELKNKYHGANVEGEELDEEETNEEDKANELYRDVNVNLEGRDTEMTNAPCTIVQELLLSNKDTAYTSIDSIFNLNNESTSLVDVPVTTIAETPLSSATTLPP
ncbi:hypothetical protein Tco_0851031 [Tanacetum coccineum]